MKKVLVPILALAGVAVGLRKVLGDHTESLTERCCDMCEKKMERMPESFPPKKMFGNLAAIREQTEEILQLLKEREGAVS